MSITNQACHKSARCYFKLEALGKCIPLPRHLTIVMIHIQIRDPDHQQNVIICSLAHCRASLKISCKSIQRFLCKVADKQTDRQTKDDKGKTECYYQCSNIADWVAGSAADL